MTAYVEAARALPTPSAEQTRAFAHYVTGAHSWYKHLPILPFSPFVFYLDPNAGRSMVHLPEDQVQFVDNVEGQSGLHYTWQTTDNYRRQFGHWNYDAPYGKSLMYASDMGVVDTAGAGLNVADADSTCWLEIPPHLTEAGTALASALMFRLGSGPEGELLPEPKYQVSLFEPCFDRLPDGDEGGVAITAIRQLMALREEVSYQSEESEFTQAIDALYEKAAAAIAQERAVQIEGMRAAMRRFVDALHSGAMETK